MTIDNLKQLLELGWPGIVTAFLCIMAYHYYQDTRNEIAYLRARIDKLETDLDTMKKSIRQNP